MRPIIPGPNQQVFPRVNKPVHINDKFLQTPLAHLIATVKYPRDLISELPNQSCECSLIFPPKLPRETLLPKSCPIPPPSSALSTIFGWQCRMRIPEYTPVSLIHPVKPNQTSIISQIESVTHRKSHNIREEERIANVPENCTVCTY